MIHNQTFTYDYLRRKERHDRWQRHDYKHQQRLGIRGQAHTSIVYADSFGVNTS